MGLLTSLILAMLWSFLISFLTYKLIHWQEPNILLKLIFGYGFGLYLSLPNFGLYNMNTLPPKEVKRTALIYVVSSLTFVITSTVFIFLAQ